MICQLKNEEALHCFTSQNTVIFGRENPPLEQKLMWRVSNCSAKQSMFQNYGNFKRSAAPSRLMYYQDGCWTDFSDKVVQAVKVAFMNRNPMLEVNVDGNHYTFDFYRMLHINVVHGFERSIAWIDINGSCFFPKKFVCVDVDYKASEIPKIEVEVRLGSSSSIKNDEDDYCTGSGKRKRAEDIKLESEREDTATSASANSKANNKLKKRRVILSVQAPAVANRWPNTKLMMGWEKAYPALRDSFLAGMKSIDPDCEITAIRQFSCSGPMEKARWDVFLKQLEFTKAARGNARPVSAWYGTSKEGAMEILGHGFGSQSMLSGSQSYGLGVYLSSMRYPHMSHTLTELDENGERHLLLCRVILGNVETVEAGSLQTHPSCANFDAGVDNVDDPKWYVVWSTNMNTHILPMCVVSYKCSKHPQEMIHVRDVKKYLPSGSSVLAVNFLSALSRNLPSRKAETLKALCKLYKDGKIAKDTFIRQMRLLAGDQIVCSAIRDCQVSK